jgi:hypothetical protein
VFGEESSIRPGNYKSSGAHLPIRLPQTKPSPGHLCTSPPRGASANRAFRGAGRLSKTK